MNRVESRKNRVPSPKKNGKRAGGGGMASTKGARLSSAWTFDDHRTLTPVSHPLHILLLVLPLTRRYTRPLRSAPSISRFRRELHGTAAARWRWLIVAPLSRDNEISVCATRPPAGATLSFLYLRSFDVPLPLRRWTDGLRGLPPRRRDLLSRY